MAGPRQPCLRRNGRCRRAGGRRELSQGWFHTVAVLRRLFPLVCPSCAALCCRVCPECSAQFPERLGNAVPAGLDALWCRFAYDGAVRRLVLAAKATSAHGWLEEMAELLPAPPALFAGLDRRSVVVTWPTGSDAHRRRRGYDPAQRLARPYARSLRVRAVPLLLRTGGAQEGLSAEQRHGVRFAVRQPLVHGTVIVVDDVVTTGASMSQAALALRRAGAHTVIGVAFAQRERFVGTGK